MSREMADELERIFPDRTLSKGVVKFIRNGLDNRQGLPEPKALKPLIIAKDQRFFDWLYSVNTMVKNIQDGKI